jgi:hypothetical protein
MNLRLQVLEEEDRVQRRGLEVRWTSWVCYRTADTNHLTLGTKNVELVARLWTRVQLPDRLHLAYELINTIHKKLGFKIKAFLIQSLADNSMTTYVAVGCCCFETRKKKSQLLLTPSGELRHINMRFSTCSDPEL